MDESSAKVPDTVAEAYSKHINTTMLEKQLQI